MDTDTSYHMFKLLNTEFTFDVDVSTLPCGLNGALYFSEMDQDGGMARFPTNKAGAQYGTGYCDSQCPKDLKFIDGMVRAAMHFFPKRGLIRSFIRQTWRAGRSTDFEQLKTSYGSFYQPYSSMLSQKPSGSLFWTAWQLE